MIQRRKVTLQKCPIEKPLQMLLKLYWECLATQSCHTSLWRTNVPITLSHDWHFLLATSFLEHDWNQAINQFPIHASVSLFPHPFSLYMDLPYLIAKDILCWDVISLVLSYKVCWHFLLIRTDLFLGIHFSIQRVSLRFFWWIYDFSLWICPLDHGDSILANPIPTSGVLIPLL